MSATAASKFRNIRDFPELVEYLGDELDWPIETDDFEEMTFEYSATELGLDLKTAPKFLEIRRLRPLDKDQPWGIFFIRFDDSKLPVVALRRLLSKLVLNKRSTSNAGDRASWHESDLLLISQTGSLGTQSISFAHFAANPEKTDLPILKVLGWDDDDTGLKIDYVIETLREKLAWPEDPTDSDVWRTQWREAFTLKNREVIQSSKEMAERLGQLALAVRTRLREVLAIENEEGPIHKLMSVFKENLISDLDTDSFSDMYAQTIAYGLLSARIINPKANTADAAHTQIPITNPFLRDLMETFLNVGGRDHAGGVGLDFDELGISEVVDLLDNTNMEAVLRDFGDRNQKEDPVMHFFEGFLQEYDSKIRKDRGVFYTPQPVVSFIVRSVDEQLRMEFGLEDGLADTTTWGELAKRTANVEIPEGISPDQAFVQILDPATGTGTFPVEVIDLIHKTMIAKWRSQGNREAKIKELWNEYVPKHLLPRLHGYELMMAPYAIAHMKIGLKLYETGYRFYSDQRARIYLTNALEPAHEFSGAFAFAIPSLAREAQAVSAIKRDQCFTVVIGNPPYSGISSNLSPWIDGLLKGKLPNGSTTESYYQVDGQPLGERKLWLQDDYVKFIRFSQYCLKRAGAGILGFITNHGYLDNPTFRGMRSSLMVDFNKIQILDLHGNLKKKESSPNGGKDENVFEIQQGVAIGLFISQGLKHLATTKSSVYHADLWGERDRKYSWLNKQSINQTDGRLVGAEEPFYLFTPFDQSESSYYYGWPAINGVMQVNVTGVQTSRDDFVIDFDQSPLRERISDLRNTSLSDQAIREKYFKGKGAKKYAAGDSRSWRLPEAREKVIYDEHWDERYVPILYRPFDIRQIYYVPWMIDWPRTETMPHMVAGENIAIMVGRAGHVIGPGEWEIVFASRMMSDLNCYRRGGNNLFPLYLYPRVGTSVESMFHGWPEGKAGRRPNLDAGFVRTIEEATELLFQSDGCGDLCKTFGPEDVLSYIYAIFNCPSYRTRFKPMLKLDFPRVPTPVAKAPFLSLVRLGHALLSVHLLEATTLDSVITTRIERNKSEVEKVSYSDETVWIDEARTRGFRGVSEKVWNFSIGGYQVCEKWLKERQAKGGKNPRPGRVLSDEDIKHYQKIVNAINETIRIMAEIDKSIESYGGWPDAFIVDS